MTRLAETDMTARERLAALLEELPDSVLDRLEAYVLAAIEQLEWQEFALSQFHSWYEKYDVEDVEYSEADVIRH
jgi:hypothetical protein